MICSHLDSQKADRLRCAALYLCFGLYMLLCHLPLPLYGDDAAILPFTATRSFFQQLEHLYHYNGKIFTDFAAFLLLHIPYTLWKVLNSAVFVLVVALLVHLFTDKKPQSVLLSCGLVMIFPLWYLGTAGYIATCTNYLYPLTGLLLVACQMKAVCAEKKVPVYLHFLLLPVMAYLLNQDQAACILVGGLLLLWLYVAFLSPKRKQIVFCVAVYFFVALVGYIILFLLPGHLNRMADPSEMETFLPEYADWSIGKKIYRGFTATVALIFFDDITFAALFFFLLFLVCQEKGNLWCRMISMLPLGGFLLVKLLNLGRFIQYDHVLPDLKALTTLGGLAGLGLSCVYLFCAVFTICKTCSPNTRWLLLSLLILGGGSRLVMGFSPTLYGSAERTFTYLVFALIAGCLVLLQELKTDKTKALYYAGAAGIAITLLQK